MAAYLRHRFAAWLLGALLLSLAGLAGFNALMDAYDFFGSPRMAGVNADKVMGDSRLTKAWRVAEGRYDGLVLGTSRGEVGLNPAHPAWDGLEAYNFSLAGASLYEIYRNLQHAQAARPLRQVLLGLDFFNFSVDQSAPPPFVEARLRVAADGTLQDGRYWLRDAANVLLSEDGYRRSLETWRTNRQGRGPTHTGAGQISQSRWFLGVRNQGGFRAAFASFERNYFRKGGNWLSSPEFSYRLHDPATGASTMVTFEAILEFCHQHDIRLVLFTSPVHARLQAGLYAIGLWDAFANWKRLLAASNHSAARRHGHEPFVLLDFADLNAYTTDPLPAAGETRQSTTIDGMRWYWDSAHYRSVLGDTVQDRLFFDRPATEDAGFGKPLTPATVEALLEAQRLALRDYRNRYPDDWADIVATARRLNTLNPLAADLPD